MTKKTSPVLLSKHVIPTHYSIYLEPDLENFIFIGEEEIDLIVSKPISRITLHSAEIEVASAKIVKDKTEESAQKISYDDKSETATFTFSSKFEGKVKLKLFFSGILNDKMRGFYRSRYTHNGKTYHMGVTQFESTDARRAFPCFDEPAHKATFDVSLKVPSDRTVISNTLEEEIIEHEGGYKVVRFEKSPKMSSYLLAFIVGHFEYIETTTREGVKVRVYVTPGKKKQAKFALDTASKIMSFYHNYFGIAYPLPTMDLIAIPDFANGAMENWGAVTYRETALLVDPEHSSLHTKQWVALIIAHELAHQWFGNLVTMKWWTHLWLNEGFASFMEYHAVDKLFPKWNIWTQFIFTEQARALALDGLLNTHAIEIPVHHPGEISEIFDAVSYSKGASVIRMIENYIGESTFQKGLRLYLRTHQYSNAETKDLWSALEKVSGQPIGKIMKDWTTRPGYPLVSVDCKNGMISLHQRRYLSSPVKNASREKWLIPLSFISDDKKNPIKKLVKQSSTKISGFSKSEWIKVNSGDTSFVRVKYSRDLLEKMQNPINSLDKKLGEEGRFALVRDIFALNESGEIRSDEALKFVNFFKHEESYIVWAEIITHLLELRRLLSGSDVERDFDEFGRTLLFNITKRVGWAKKKNDSHEQTLLRSLALYASGTMGDKTTLDMALTVFKDSTKNGGIIDSDLRTTIYSLVAENGTRKEFEIFFKIYNEADSEEEKDRALKAMCSFKDEKLSHQVLKIAFSKDVRAQDAFKAVYLLCQNPNGIELTWDYVISNWSVISEKFAGGHLFARFISPFAMFKTRKNADKVDAFFKEISEKGIERTVAQTIEKILSNASLLERDLSRIELFLKN